MFMAYEMRNMQNIVTSTLKKVNYVLSVCLYVMSIVTILPSYLHSSPDYPWNIHVVSEIFNDITVSTIVNINIFNEWNSTEDW